MVDADSVDSRALASGSVGMGPVAFGYNHQIPHGGRIYHVQTEDSGRGKGRIFTHVFHAGAIVATSRVDYDGAARVRDVVELLRRSHKSMILELVHGALDDAIAGCLGVPRLSPATRSTAEHRSDGPRPPRLALRATTASPTEPSANDDPGRAANPPAHELRALMETLDMENVKQILENLRSNVAGTLGVALVDYESGMCLGTSGTGLNMDVAAAGNMEVMKAKSRVMRDLGIKGGIEDILITLDSQYHIIRPVGSALFLYLAIDRQQGNLAMARHKLAAAAADVQV